MITRAAIVTEARRWVGTPYQHQQRLMGVAVDCAGLVIEVGRALGSIDVHYSDYGMLPNRGLLRHLCDKHLQPITAIEDGCVLIMSFTNKPGEEQHLAIVTGERPDEPWQHIVHAHRQVAKAVETRYSEHWQVRTRAIYRYPGVA